MNKILIVALIAVTIFAIGGYFFPQVQEVVVDKLGRVGTQFPHGITVGLVAETPPNIAKILVGSCALLGADVSQAATTTRPYDCAVTGVTSADYAFGSFATTTAMVNGAQVGLQWAVTGAKASTTAGYVTFLVTNFTGADRVLSTTNIASTTQYQVFETQ